MHVCKKCENEINMSDNVLALSYSVNWLLSVPYARRRVSTADSCRIARRRIWSKRDMMSQFLVERWFLFSLKH